MAVVTVKSTQITNRDAVPLVKSNGVQDASVMHSRGTCAVANGDSVGSKYIACSVPSNSRVTSVRLSAPDLGTTTTTDVGLYKSTADGGAVVDADFFASAYVLNVGPYLRVEVSQESGVYTLANMEKALWEALALTSDPKLNYDVVATLTGASDAAGNILLEVEYTM